MVEVVLDTIADKITEGTIQTWYAEEGDAINEGDELVEIATEEGSFIIQCPTTGVLTEVYYDEGETVSKGEVICTIDDEEEAL